MTILYSVIARGGTILCSHQSNEGNFETVAHSILPNIPTRNDAKTSYTSNKYVFHVMVENGIIYMCASEPESGKLQPYAYLDDIKQQFKTTGQAQFATEGSMQHDFGPVMARQMESYSTSNNAQLNSLQSQVDEVKGVMVRNIEGVLARGERLEDLLDKTTDLEASANTFQTASRRVHRKYWWKNLKMKIILACVVIVILIVIILIILFSTGVLPPKKHDAISTTLPPTTSP